MPEVKVKIGGRVFEVACQEGEQPYLETAAQMLDAEAAVLGDQIGRMPEGRMLLMAGLMLADKTAAGEEQVAALEKQVETLKTEIAGLQARPAPPPQRVEVPVVPNSVADTLAELAARAEALAAEAEEITSG